MLILSITLEIIIAASEGATIMLETTPSPSTPALDYTPQVASLTAPIFQRVKHVIPEVEWPVHASTLR